MKFNFTPVRFLGLLILASLLWNTSVSASDIIVNDDTYRVIAKKIKKSNTTHIEITIESGATVHCNVEYPWKMKLLSIQGAQSDTTSLALANAVHISDKKVVFQMPYSLKAKHGNATIQLKFSMCDDKQCYMKKIEIQVPL